MSSSHHSRKTASSRRLLAVAVAGLAATLSIQACGGSGDPPPAKGAVVTGLGVQTTSPPWTAEYAHIKQRLAARHLPAPGKERFHVHQLLHIYADGILVPVAANVGIDESQHVETALHTHDQSGVIHMEADRPFRATLGDFFKVWGLAFGPDHIGGLKASGDKALQVFVNGRPITDPAAHVFAKNDDIVIVSGSTDGVPLVSDKTALKAANGKGGTPVACSIDKSGKKQTACFVHKK